MDPMESIRQVYFQECEELLLAMEEGLSQMEAGEADSEKINAVFRAVHSIKGSGGAFGYDALVTFAHKFESVLDDVRSGRVEPRPDLMKVLLRAGDILAAGRSLQAAALGHKDPSLELLADYYRVTSQLLVADGDQTAAASL